MKKVITISIELKESVKKYVVPRSNFKGAYIIGVPCLVVSEPYPREEFTVGIGHETREVCDVISTVTGYRYTVPIEWVSEYDTLGEANTHSYIGGSGHPSVLDLLGKEYWPLDNSHISIPGAPQVSSTSVYHLRGKKCTIVSTPYTRRVGQDDMMFINVRYWDTVYSVLFYECCLYNYTELWNRPLPLERVSR